MAKILVVDDSSLICQVTKEFLEPLGHEISVAKSGEGLVSLVDKEKPQLVIMDVHLTDASGFNICQRLREKGHTFPILLSSASNSFGPWVDHLAQGFLFKPFSEETLRAKVKALLESPPYAAVPDPKVLAWDSSNIFVHHLRNSVGCLAGLLDMLKLKREDKAFREQFINLAQQAVDAGVVLLDEFALLSQPLELKRETIAVESWLTDVVAKHPISRAPKIKLRWQLDTGSLAPLHADPVKLTRAVEAILDNAIDVMAGNGTLTIGAYGDANRRWVYVNFQDTGVGMDEYVLEHAFVPFFTVKEKRRGLGLSWAQKIVTAHAGQVEITSSVNKGATVLIKIPAAIRAAK